MLVYSQNARFDSSFFEVNCLLIITYMRVYDIYD